ncbi:MAG: hypothetical protein ACRCST_06285 [Turicibacter sp.]
MFAYSELHQLNKIYNMNHPIFACYDISVEPVNYRSFILKIDNLALLVEATHDRVKTGIVKLLESTEHSVNFKRDLKGADASTDEPASDYTERYRVVANLALLSLAQTREFEKDYKPHYKKFKKAIKEYERLRKIDRKEALKEARTNKTEKLI